MNKSTFDGMIDKYQEGKYTGKHKEILDQWFDVQQMDASVEIWTEEAKRNTKNRILSVIDGIESGKSDPKKVKTVPLKRKEPRKEFRINPSLRAVAVVLITILAIYLAWVNKTGQWTLFPVASERVTKVMLDDGSIVWLKGKNSKLIYPDKFTGNERHVTLQGEALFEVVKDPLRPFIIQCNDLTATVLGTSFNIQSDTTDIEVVVLTGKVAVSTDHNADTVVVLPREKVAYNNTQRQFVKTSTAYAEASAVVKGTGYHMAFEDTKLREIIPRIEGKFDVAVSVNDLSLCNCLVTADFTGQSLNSSLEMLSRDLNINYTIKDNKVLLDGKGCK